MTDITRPPPGSPLLDHSPPSLPAHWYFDQGHHDRELRELWARNWIFAGRDGDLAPMSLRRLAVAGQNLVLVKDQAGTVTCFHNTCRHRGSELCATDEVRLKSRLITCPYHGWAYGLDGRLVHTPFVSPVHDFRKEDHGLFAVHVRRWSGLLFVCLAAEPPPFEAAPDLGVDALANWPIADLVTGHTLTKDMACNWKIFWENFNECLHCPGIHPELCDMVPVYGRGYMAANEAPGWTPSEEAGTLLRPGARTWTMDGRPCGPEFAGLTAEERARGQTFVTLWPTLYVVAHVDYVRIVSLEPTGPERTRLTAQWLFPRATLEAPDFDLDRVTGFATMVMLQDAAACEMNQRGLRAPPFAAGRLMPQEFDVHRFQQWVRQHLA
jgi:Rieske 2Fe-2S family protein